MKLHLRTFMHENDHKGGGIRWREAIWWVALIVLMGAMLALATWANGE